MLLRILNILGYAIGGVALFVVVAILVIQDRTKPMAQLSDRQMHEVNCNCPQRWTLANHLGDSAFIEKPDTSFYFSNGKTISLCMGYKDTIYSEFVLTVCGQDTAIDMWGDTWHQYRIHFIKDTLTLEEITSLPIGKHFKLETEVWTTEKLFFVNGVLNRNKSLNRYIHKYSEKEIQLVIKECNEYKGQKDFRTKAFDKRYNLSERLFVATISGSKDAREIFNNFEKQIGTLDGIYAETYDYDLKEKLKEWDAE